MKQVSGGQALHLCVHLRNWPIDRLLRRKPELRHKPFVVVETTAHRQMVTAVSPDIPPTVLPGMSLAQAQAHCAQLLAAPAEPEKDRQSLKALAYWLMQFSPSVSICQPSSIFLDASGLEKLFGDSHALANRVEAALKRLNLNASVAIAPTPAAAWGFAVFAEHSGTVVTAGNLIAALSRLPPEALRLESDTAQSLRSLGITRIGLLLQIPRGDLVRRFGPAIVHRIDQAMGTIPEPLNWLPPRSPIGAEIEFGGAVGSIETLHDALRRVLDEVVEKLAGRGLGAKQLRLILRQPYAPPIEKPLSLLRCSRDAAALFKLLRCALENVETDEGFTALGLSVVSAERLGDQQAAIVEDEAEQNAAELDHLIERLRAKFGDIAEWAEPVEAYPPERAFLCRNEPFSSSPGTPGEDRGGGLGKGASSRSTPSPALPRSTGGGATSRPLSLLPSPRNVRVIVMPSQSRDGQPVAFTDNNQVHRLIHVRGPQRIAGQWWTGSGKTRDYFDVVDAAGNRYWLFRVLETNQWYLHGIFE